MHGEFFKFCDRLSINVTLQDARSASIHGAYTDFYIELVEYFDIQARSDIRLRQYCHHKVHSIFYF